jgi:hypothetical protein
MSSNEQKLKESAIAKLIEVVGLTEAELRALGLSSNE